MARERNGRIIQWRKTPKPTVWFTWGGHESRRLDRMKAQPGICTFVCNVGRFNCTIDVDKDRRLPSNAPSGLD